MEPFHARLKRLRKSRGLSMRTLAQKTGVPASTYRDWEYGAAVSGEPYAKIAKALGVSLHQLLDEEGIKSKNLLHLLESLEALIKDIKREVLPLI